MRWVRSHSLCASQYLDLKAIDKLFLWTNPSVLACNPVCDELRPSSSLFSVRRGWSLILFGCHKERKSERRGVREDDTNLMFFCLSCLSLFLIDCLSLTFIFYLTLHNPSFFSFPPNYQLPLQSPLARLCLRSDAEVIVIMKTLACSPSSPASLSSDGPLNCFPDSLSPWSGYQLNHLNWHFGCSKRVGGEWEWQQRWYTTTLSVLFVYVCEFDSRDLTTNSNQGSREDMLQKYKRLLWLTGCHN